MTPALFTRRPIPPSSSSTRATASSTAVASTRSAAATHTSAADLLGHGVQVRARPPDQTDRVPRLRQAERDPPADPPPGTGDQRGPHAIAPTASRSRSSVTFPWNLVPSTKIVGVPRTPASMPAV